MARFTTVLLVLSTVFALNGCSQCSHNDTTATSVPATEEAPPATSGDPAAATGEPIATPVDPAAQGAPTDAPSATPAM